MKLPTEILDELLTATSLFEKCEAVKNFRTFIFENEIDSLDFSNLPSINKILDLLLLGVHHTSVKSLNFSRCKLSLDFFKSLAEELPKSNIIELNFNGNPMSDEGLFELSKALKNSKIEKLSLVNCQLNKLMGPLLRNILVSMPNLSSLNLSSNFLGNQGLQTIFMGLKLVRLRSLDLSSNQLNSQSCKDLAQLVINNSQLAILSLGQNILCGHIFNPYFSKLMASFLQSQVINLDLTNVCSEESDFTPFVNTLAYFVPKSRIEYLNLQCNWLPPSAAKTLGKMLSDCKRLYELNLKGNRLSDVGAQWLAPFLAGTKFARLGLSFNRISEWGATAIAEHLPKSKISHLDLSGNFLRKDGALAIMEATTKEFRPFYLDLSLNWIKDAGIAELIKFLQVAPIFRLALRSNELSDQSAKLMNDAIQNSYLVHLDLKGNSISQPWIAEINQTLKKNELWLHDVLSQTNIGMQSLFQQGTLLDNLFESKPKPLLNQRKREEAPSKEPSQRDTPKRVLNIS